MAEYGCVSEQPGMDCDPSVVNHPSGVGRPDFSVAAEKPGASDDGLMRARGAPPPNLDQAADTLGITVEALLEALGRP